MIKLVILVVLVAVLGVGGHDAYEIVKTRNDLNTTVSQAAGAAVDALHKNAKDPSGGRAAADAEASACHAVITKYSWQPTADKVMLTVSAVADTWIVGRVDSKIAKDISASTTARP